MSWRALPTIALLAALLFCAASAAHAAGVRGEGKAAASEWKKGGTLAKARARALRRARNAALKQAIEDVSSSGAPVDKSARKAVLSAGGAWTGAYRILSETATGDAVTLVLEVEIDVPRLSKRLLVRGADTKHAPLYRVGAADGDPTCAAIAATAADELVGLGATTTRPDAPAVSLKLTCTVAGPVPNTLLVAARVAVVVQAGGKSLIETSEAGFGADDATALGHAMGRSLERVAAVLGSHRRGEVVVRIESPLPAVRVRRLQRALRDSVVGVRSSEVVGIDADGAVLLAVRGSLAADGLAARMSGLSLPGFGLNVVAVEGIDALTVRLR